MTIHNRNRSNREPRTRARYNVEYVSGNCPNCGVPYALEAGKEFHPENCWMCAYIATHKTTAHPAIVDGVSSPEWWDAQEERSL